MPICLRRLGALIAFALAAPLSWAQSADEPSLEIMIVTATRIPTAADAVPLNISVLDRAALEKTQAAHIQQAISQVPGVTTQRGNGQESLPGIRSAVLTGAGACGSVLILEDAIPVRGPAFCNVNELFDTHFEAAESIEVTRGPGSAFYGSNALTGLVNVNLSATGPEYAELEAGSFGYFRAQLAQQWEREAAQRLLLTATRDGGYRDESGYDQLKLSWRYARGDDEFGQQAGLTLTALDQETAGFIVGEDAYRDRALARENLDPEGFRESRSLRLWSRWSRALDDGQRAQWAVYARVTDMAFRMHFLPGDPFEENDQIGFGWQSSVHTDVSDSLSTVVGFDGDWSQGALLQYQNEPTRGSAFLRATIPTGVQYDYEVDAKQLATFAQARWEPAVDWQIIAGLRAERLDYDYDNLALDGRTRDDGQACGFGGCRYARPADRSDAFTDWSPKLQIKYRASDRWQWYAAASVSARAPQATELYRLQRAQQVADLDSVEATNIELGVRYQSESARWSLSAYRLDIENAIIRDADFFNVDGNETRSEGLELDVDWQLTDALNLRLAGTLADHQYASDQLLGGVNINGLQVDTAPKSAGSVRLDWQATDKTQLAIQLQHLAKYYLEPTNQFEYEGHDVINLFARYQLNEHWSLSARLLNAADERYAERADYTSFTDQRYFPGEPRSLFVSIRRDY